MTSWPLILGCPQGSSQRHPPSASIHDECDLCDVGHVETTPYTPESPYPRTVGRLQFTVGSSRQPGRLLGKNRSLWPRAKLETRKSKLENLKDVPPPPHLFSELRILKGLRGRVFVTAHFKGLSRPNRGTAHSKGLRPGGSAEQSGNFGGRETKRASIRGPGTVDNVPYDQDHHIP